MWYFTNLLRVFSRSISSTLQTKWNESEMKRWDRCEGELRKAKLFSRNSLFGKMIKKKENNNSCEFQVWIWVLTSKLQTVHHHHQYVIKWADQADCRLWAVPCTMVIRIMWLLCLITSLLGRKEILRIITIIMFYVARSMFCFTFENYNLHCRVYVFWSAFVIFALWPHENSCPKAIINYYHKLKSPNELNP